MLRESGLTHKVYQIERIIVLMQNNENGVHMASAAWARA
jgi:hypothetical protein